MILDSKDSNNTRLWVWFSKAAHQTHSGATVRAELSLRLAALALYLTTGLGLGILNGTETFFFFLEQYNVWGWGI